MPCLRAIWLAQLSCIITAISASSLSSRARPPDGFYNPADGGGSLLTIVPGTYPAGLGEPINVILSASSDAAVLRDREDEGGLRNYFLSFQFSGECLGQHLGADQQADLGDGNGPLNETAVIRYNYGNPYTGACEETVKGGNHFRYWIQNGPKNNSGAIFMALSYEKPIADDHDIVPNGYDFARDYLVGNATASNVPTLDLSTPIPEFTNFTTNITTPAVPGYLPTFSGSTSYNGYTYQTSVTYITGLLSNSSNGINHYITVELNGRPAIDGLVALLEVKITDRPKNSAAGLDVPRTTLILGLLGLIALFGTFL